MNKQDREFREMWRLARHMSRGPVDGISMRGFGVVHLMDGDGQTKQLDPFTNLITTAGDQYAAQKLAALIPPLSPSSPTAANGMKLSTGTTTAAKSGAGAALTGTYVTGSNVAFDTSYPQTSAVGGDTGWYTTYKTTWLAGIATNATINSVAVVNDQATASASTAANTYSIAVITLVNKTASDILAITWAWKSLGA